MRVRWVLTVVACLLLAGVGSAQPKKSAPMSSPSAPRAALPPGAPAIGNTNQLNERSNQQGYVENDRRSMAENLSRMQLQSEKSARDYLNYYDQLKESKRVAIEPAQLRSRALLSQLPDDKVNRLDEFAKGRSFAAPAGSRFSLPSNRYAPNDRQGTVNR